ncbi:hypothetical protein SUGI_0077660 [Cryptomeria japonica]|nr:hypothetical protein SUGI_0077660 [Cryptomeria japonica]
MFVQSRQFSEAELQSHREVVGRLTQIIIAANHVNAECQYSICTEPFHLRDDARQMPCHESHIFHTRCLLQWLVRRDNCPICRTHLLRPVNGRADFESNEFVTSTTSNNG